MYLAVKILYISINVINGYIHKESATSVSDAQYKIP